MVQVIESYSYFSLSVAFTLYLSDNFGVSDYKVNQTLSTVLHPVTQRHSATS